MKKITFLTSALFAVASLSAQDLVSKKGEPFLPAANDYSISVDATPFLNYFGNFLSNDGGSAPTLEFLGNQTIVGRMFKDDKMAYRGILRIGLTSSSSKSMIGKDGASAPTYPALPEMVEDKRAVSATNIAIGGGLEWRRGSTRLQGYYGADLMIGFSGSSQTFTYGNALKDNSNIGAITTNFGNNITNDTYQNQARVTKRNDGSTFMFGVRGFAGVEYFILPKISFGGEFGWGLGFSSTSGGYTEIESRNGTTLGTQKIEGAGGSSFGIDTDRNSFLAPSGQLRANFYF